jgi:hypothetical protein
MRKSATEEPREPIATQQTHEKRRTGRAWVGGKVHQKDSMSG